MACMIRDVGMGDRDGLGVYIPRFARRPSLLTDVLGYEGEDMVA